MLSQQELIGKASEASQVMKRSLPEIQDWCRQLRISITEYATIHSPIYSDHHSIITKSDLVDKFSWYTRSIEHENARTSGSTTGRKFEYRRWTPIFRTIERDSHYKLILNEFGIRENPNILYLIGDRTVAPNTTTLIKTYKTDNIMISHGAEEKATVHEVFLNQAYFKDYHEFYKQIVDYARVNDIDVILASGSIFSALRWHLLRYGIKDRITKLISNTSSIVDTNDLQGIVDNGNAEDWCDHMRCWDGGATFYTCKYHTYHLMDSLAWVYMDDNNRLISYDYFSLASPFINYWNGDYCNVSTAYDKCKCGAYYRYFKMGRTRDMTVRSGNSIHIRSAIADLDIMENVKRVEVVNNMLRIVSTKISKETDRQHIRKSLPRFQVQFVCEEVL